MPTIEEQIAALQAENDSLKAKPPSKERNMTPKGFLHKCTTKAANSAIAFLSAHREWLVNGELASVTSPILHRLDQGALLPTPALREIQQVVMAHIIASDTHKVEETIEKAGRAAKPKNWVAQILNAKGEIQTRVAPNGEVEDLVKSFDMSSDADRWSDRRLFDGASDWYAEVSHVSMNVKTIIQRQDAIARILKKPKGPAVHSKGTSTRTLGFGVKAKQDRACFSRG